MRWNTLGLVLALAAGALGCGSSTKTWTCGYACTNPVSSGTATIQDDDKPEAEDKCEATYRGQCATTNFTCVCVQAP